VGKKEKGSGGENLRRRDEGISYEETQSASGVSVYLLTARGTNVRKREGNNWSGPQETTWKEGLMGEIGKVWLIASCKKKSRGVVSQQNKNFYEERR